MIEESEVWLEVGIPWPEVSGLYCFTGDLVVYHCDIGL